MAIVTTSAFHKLAGVEILEQEPLSRHTSLGIGGPADILALPHHVEALRQLLVACHGAGIKPFIIGNGTNIIVRDGGWRGVVIKLSDNFSKIRREGNLWIAESGASLPLLCKQACCEGFQGLGFAAGIPGTVGGAVWMNAGTNEGDMGSVVRQLRAFTLAGEEVLLTGDSLHFAYRHSDLQGQDLVVGEVVFELTPGDPNDLYSQLCCAIQTRCERQPVAHNSAGSIFKRPPGDYAGRLVEAVGGKGLQVGGARISPKHANFIINTGGATATDVLDLIAEVRQRVFDLHGVWLETEVCVVGEEA